MVTKKKIVIILSVLLVIILIALAISFVFMNKKNNVNSAHLKSFFESKILTSMAETKKLDNSKPTFIMFYGNYCKTCHDFMPAFHQLAKDYKDKYNFALLDIQDPANYPIVSGNVGSIPALYIFDSEIGNKIHISLSALRSYDELKAELDRYLRIRSFIDLEKAKAEQNKLIQAYYEELQNLEKKESK